MKKLLILLCCVFFGMASCSTDNDNSENETLELINALTGNPNDVWTVEAATLSNTSVTELAVGQAYNLSDDEFKFTKDDSGDLLINWQRGLDINSAAGSLESFLRDTRVSTLREILMYDSSQATFISSSEGIKMSYNAEDRRIQMTVTFSAGAQLRITLREKLASDYKRPVSGITGGANILSIENATAWAGFKYLPSQERLYLSSFGNSAEGEEFILRYDINSDELIQFFTQREENDHPSMHLELLGDVLYNLGGSFHQTFELDLNPINNNYPVANAWGKFGTAVVDDRIYFTGGYLEDLGDSQIGVSLPPYTSVEILEDLPDVLIESDSEIVDDALYIFGGWDPSLQNDGSDQVVVYNITDGASDSVALPVTLQSARTCIVENLIYVGGQLPTDDNNDGLRDNYLGAFNLIDNSFQLIELAIPGTENMTLINLQIAGNEIFTVFYENIPGPGGINHIYRSPLD